MVTQPRFLPWPNQPDDRRFKGARLLILGESHYEEPEQGVSDHSTSDPNFTQQIVQDWGARPQGRQRFFANLYEMMTGDPWRQDANHGQLWDHVFFYNYVQTLVAAGDDKKPTPSQFQNSEQQFRSLLEMIRPEAILVMGERLWQGMVTEDEWVDDLEGPLGRVCSFHLDNGFRCVAGHTWHPSAPGFNPQGWHERVSSFLEDAAEYHAASAKAR